MHKEIYNNCVTVLNRNQTLVSKLKKPGVFEDQEYLFLNFIFLFSANQRMWMFFLSKLVGKFVSAKQKSNVYKK